MNKCIFLDRDGVLNEERGTYTYIAEDLVIIQGVPEAIRLIKNHGYLAIVITNQSGIEQGLYTRAMMESCHKKLNDQTDNLIDAIYYAPGHPSVSESLSRKPDTLMLEKAIAKFNIDVSNSWMIGDKERDISCGNAQKLKTILISQQKIGSAADYQSDSLLNAVNDHILI